MKYINLYNQFQVNENQISSEFERLESEVISLLNELHIKYTIKYEPINDRDTTIRNLNDNPRGDFIASIFTYFYKNIEYGISVHKFWQNDEIFIDFENITNFNMKSATNIEELRNIILQSVDISPWLLKMNETDSFWDLLQKMDIPGVPRKFPTHDKEKHNIIINIFNKLNIKYEFETEILHGDTYYEYTLIHSGGNISLQIQSYGDGSLGSTLDIIDNPSNTDDNYESIDTPYELIDYLYEVGLYNNNNIFKIINENYISSEFERLESEVISLLNELHIKYTTQYTPVNDRDTTIQDLKYNFDGFDGTIGVIFTYILRDIPHDIHIIKPPFSLKDGLSMSFVDETHVKGISDIDELKNTILHSVDISPWLLKMNENTKNDFIDDHGECEKYIKDLLDKYNIKYDYYITNVTDFNFNLKNLGHTIEGKVYVDEDNGDLMMVLFITENGKSTFDKPYHTTKKSFMKAFLKMCGIDMVEVIKKINGFI